MNFRKVFSEKLIIVFVLIIVSMTGYLILTNKSPSLFEEKLIACKSIENNSIQNIAETTRLFINLPKDVYPDKEHNLQFKTINGNATAGWISNAGPYGEAFETTPDCWSYYYEFNGNGEVDLKVKSAISEMPNYFARFTVK